LAKGNITSTNLEGPLAGKKMSDLISLIKNGSVYVNVHTEANPQGEVRGQSYQQSNITIIEQMIKQ
jgi:hypothetical protein